MTRSNGCIHGVPIVEPCALCKAAAEHFGGSMSEEQKQDTIHDVPKDTKALREIIRKAARQIEEFRQQRKALNAEIQAVFERTLAKGIPKDALKGALRDNSASSEQLAQIDSAYAICRAALDKPLQIRLDVDRAA